MQVIKAYWQNLSRTRYLNRLPKKRMGAGCLLCDRQGRILILKPTYKEHWLLPGGVIEANESPRQACIREVKEETEINCQPIRLLCVDYVSNRQSKIESVQFVFLGGTISHETEIVIPKQEISSYQFLEPEVAISMLGINSQRRLERCLAHLDSQRLLRPKRTEPPKGYRSAYALTVGQRTIYLENGKQP